MLEDAGRQLARETPRAELSVSASLALDYDANDATRKGVAEHAALETHGPHWGGWVLDDIWLETAAPRARAGESR